MGVECPRRALFPIQGSDDFERRITQAIKTQLEFPGNLPSDLHKLAMQPLNNVDQSLPDLSRSLPSSLQKRDSAPQCRCYRVDEIRNDSAPRAAL